MPWRKVPRRLPPPLSAPKAPQFLKFPGKNEKLVYSARSRSWRRRLKACSTMRPRRSTNFIFATMVRFRRRPERRWWKITIDGEVNQKLELTVGELKAKFKPVTRRMVLECAATGGPSLPRRPRQPADQWRCGLRGMDRRTRGRCAQGSGVKPPLSWRTTAPTRTCQAMPASRRSPRRADQS